MITSTCWTAVINAGATLRLDYQIEFGR